MPGVTTTDGVELMVHELSGSGRPAVLVHGAGLHGRLWAPLAALLRPRFRCVAVDLRGHGCSSLPEGVRLDWNGFGRDVLATLDALGVEGAFGIGHSSGATALLLAEQARPGAFGALYCFEPVFVPPGNADGEERARRLASSARRRRDTFSSFDDALAAYASKPPFAKFSRDALAAYVEHGFDEFDDGTVRLRCAPEHEAAVYETAAAHDALARLSEVTCPVTVACGSDTDVVTAPMSEAVAARLPLGRVDVVAGVGHFGPFEDPSAVAASVETAFARR